MVSNKQLRRTVQLKRAGRLPFAMAASRFVPASCTLFPKGASACLEPIPVLELRVLRQAVDPLGVETSLPWA